MHISLLGHNHIHGADFIGDFPDAVNGYLGLVIRSKCIMRFDDKEIKVPEKTVVVYKQYTPRYYRADNEEFINDWFVFTPEYGDTDFFEALQVPFDTPVTVDDINLFSSLVQNMTYEKYSHNPFSEDTINCYMKIFFLKLVEALSAKKNSPHEVNFKMNMVYSKIHSFPFMNFSVDELAKEATISSHYFQHIYKKMFGISPMNDIINERVEYAKRILVQSDTPINKVSEMSGYENEEHFMRQFKKKTGVTPGEYRRCYKQKDN